MPIGFSDATGQIESISYNSAFDTRITRVPPSRTPPTPACKRFRAACLTACVPLLRRAVSTPRNNVNTCPLGNFGRVIAELLFFGRPKRDLVALALLERALFACSREDVRCKNALSLCPIPTERSFRCASDVVSVTSLSPKYMTSDHMTGVRIHPGANTST